MKLKNKLARKLAIVTVVLVVLYHARSKALSHKKAVAMVNQLPEILSAATIKHLQASISWASWTEMEYRLNSILDSSKFESIPTLFALGEGELVKRVEDAVNEEFTEYVISSTSKLGEFLEGSLPVATDLVVNNLREEITRYTSDYSTLAAFEENVLRLRQTIITATTTTLLDAQSQRFVRLKDIFKPSLSWKITTYARLIRHASRIRVQMNPYKQVEMWVEIETQKIVGDSENEWGLSSILSSQKFEEYRGTSSETSRIDQFVALLNDVYSGLQQGKTKFYDTLEQFFETNTEKTVLDQKLIQQYEDLYALQLKMVDDDAVLDDSQKNVLRAYLSEAKVDWQPELYMEGEVSLEEVRSLYLDYGTRLLKEVRVLILVAFVEYEILCLRAVSEGKMTCIVQFYNMRRSLDRPFFFAYAKERSYHLDQTASDFEETLRLALLQTKSTIFSTVDSTNLHSLYSTTGTFLLSLAHTYLMSDVVLLPLVVSQIKNVHDTYADIIPTYIQTGIDLEHGNEAMMTKTFVDRAFDKFLVEMEFAYVSYLISECKGSIGADLQSKIEQVNQAINMVAADLIKGTLEPYGAEYFQNLTSTYTGDDGIIDYIGMKQLVLEATTTNLADGVDEVISTYTAKIKAIFQDAVSFIDGVYSDLLVVVDSMERQVDNVDTLRQMVATGKSSLLSLTNGLETSSLTSLDQVIRATLVEVNEVQQVRLFNFFNTKLQLIKDEFTTSTVDDMVAVYETHIQHVNDAMLDLSTFARQLVRQNVDVLLDLEKRHRDNVEVSARAHIQAWKDNVVEEYSYSAFVARQSLLKAELRNIIQNSILELTNERSVEYEELQADWAYSRSYFWDTGVMGKASDLKSSFVGDLRDVVDRAKTRASDIMGQADEVIDALETQFFTSIQNVFDTTVDFVVGSFDNMLMESLVLADIVSNMGIMGLTDSPEVPADAFYRQTESTVDVEEVDGPSGLTTTEITLRLIDFDLYIVGKVEEIVGEVLLDLEPTLIEGTCVNKPPCREGWVQYENIHGVPCCRFDPESQGWLSWQVAGMFAKEIGLALVLDFELVVTAPYKFVKGINYAGKAMHAKYLKLAKVENPTRMTKAIVRAGQWGGKQAAKSSAAVARLGATKVGAKVAAKMVATKAAVKVLTKFLSGPGSVALFIFDTVSLILDLWDPAGYNDQQQGGLLRAERDSIEEYWKTELENMGITSPIRADPMYNMSTDEKSNLYTETAIDWHSSMMAEFLDANEAEMDLMTTSDRENFELLKDTELWVELEENPNILTTLVADKLENVFLQDISVRENHVNPHTDGGTLFDRKHDGPYVAPTGILEIVLNETGVKAHNILGVKKAAFKNSLKYNPMYRFAKRENDYEITRDCQTHPDFLPSFLETGTKCDIITERVHDPFGNVNPYGGYYMRTIHDCVRPVMPLVVPTLEGSLALADALAELGGASDFEAEVRQMAEEGWILKKVDAEEEFWVHYDPDKSEEELLDRTTYQKTWDDRVEVLRYEHEKAIDVLISIHVDTNLTPEEDPLVSLQDIKVVHLAQFPENWSTIPSIIGEESSSVLKYPATHLVDDDEKTTYTLSTLPTVPSWVPPYQEMYDQFSEEVEIGYAATYALNQATLKEQYEAAHVAENERLLAKAEEEGKTVDEVISEESVEGRSSEPDPPDFAVFLNGYGQVSPLYSIAKECADSGLDYNKKHGLCNFTESYCKRYGVDFFYNTDLGIYDCEISRGQLVSEYMFGTTITRSARRGWRKTTSSLFDDEELHDPLGAARAKTAKIGTCLPALGSVKTLGGVEIKKVQNGDELNHLPTSTVLGEIAKLQLDGFMA